MITTSLRDADPAAGAHVSATSDAADEMLRDVLSTPRVAAPAHRRPLAVGASVVGTAASVAIALTIVLTGGGPGAASAYAVEPNGDGSFEVEIDFALFHDPAGLQRTLNEKGIPATVLSGPGHVVNIGPGGKIQGSVTVPDCAKYDPLPRQPGITVRDPNQPVSFNTSRRFDNTSLRLRPDLLPDGASFVISILTSDDNADGVEALSGAVALGDPPTCLP